MSNEVRITDSPEQAADYAEKNIPYIVVLNEKNRTGTFPGGAYCVENADDIDEAFKDRVYRRFRGLPWNIAETARLHIREITVEDVPRLYELYDDPCITKYMEPLFPEMEKEIEYTKAYIKNVYRFYGYGMWVIVQKEDNTVIGRVGLEYKEGFDGLELGFMLGVEYQHRGYAYEACKAVITYGIKELGVIRFFAFVNEENMASIRLCGRLGFVRAGSVRPSGMNFDAKNFGNKLTEKELVCYVLET